MPRPANLRAAGLMALLRTFGSAAGLLVLTACAPHPAAFHGADLTGADYGQKWHLTDSDGKPRTQADYQGQVLLVYFGYTHCPDICPATLGHLRDTVKLLGDQQGQVRVLFVTVDAEHDTPAVLHDYVAAFGPRFTGLSGNAEELAAAAKDFKVYAEKKGDAPGISFDHAGFVYAIDRAGKPRVLYGQDATPADMAADVQQLLKS